MRLTYGPYARPRLQQKCIIVVAIPAINRSLLRSSTGIFLVIHWIRSNPVNTLGIFDKKLLTVRTGTPSLSSSMRWITSSICKKYVNFHQIERDFENTKELCMEAIRSLDVDCNVPLNSDLCAFIINHLCYSFPCMFRLPLARSFMVAHKFHYNSQCSAVFFSQQVTSEQSHLHLGLQNDVTFPS